MTGRRLLAYPSADRDHERRFRATPLDKGIMAVQNEQHGVAEQDEGDAGIGVTSVLVMLGVLAVLVVGIFWALPYYFGHQVIEVTIRN